ncbi:hypothetical protein BSL78_08578 [Apostichopus japonicus]|uniref:SAM domain-containing protein n=1 Tax=Stichopus japonicus TaxID=307972 RepID=A0A2G8L2M2_STIJA|nr:hypothetical protein BSL78_08578 [Apostichopus japonicus]
MEWVLKCAILHQIASEATWKCKNFQKGGGHPLPLDPSPRPSISLQPPHSKILQDEMSKLAVANKNYVEKLHRVYFENDDVKKRQHFESLDNEYVGITIQTPSDGPKRGLPALPQATQPVSTSCDHNSPLNSASVDDVAELLRNLKLDIYVDAFKEELVNGNLLLQLDFENLNEDLKMSRLHAKRLLMELNKRKETVT